MSAPASDAVLCINAGSSSLKFAVFACAGGAPEPIARGAVEAIGGAASAWIDALAPLARRRELRQACSDHASAFELALTLVREAGAPDVTVVGHRVVHGGARYVAPVRVDELVLAQLEALTPLAPLHLPSAIACMSAVAARLPGLPQVACFDTAFHASLPELARRLPIPERYYQAGVRRYGFHGLSYESVLSQLEPAAPDRVVIAHLGAGASLVAVKGGRAVDTTMGLTPDGGVMMATRSGDLDPGVLLHLLRSDVQSVDELANVLERESGLAAIAGTPDMKLLLERAPTDALAELAVAMFAYSVRKAIGALAAALGGLDLLVFTGGIGEHAPEIRRRACDGLGAFGIELDPARNQRGAQIVSSEASRCGVRVVHTNEELMVARHACSLGLSRGRPVDAPAPRVRG